MERNKNNDDEYHCTTAVRTAKHLVPKGQDGSTSASRKKPRKTPRAPMKTYNVRALMERIAIDVMGAFLHSH